MTRLWNRFRDFLGPQRLTALFILLAVTGLISLMLNAVEAEWVVTVQTILLLGFVGAAVGIIFSALDPFDRGRWAGILVPSFALVVLGTTIFREQSTLFFGLAFGWIIAGQFLFGSRRGPIHYQKAVKAMRRGDYEAALGELDKLVKQEPKNGAHLQFRAEIHRLSDNLKAAKRDYKRMIDLPDFRAVGYNLLAEVHLQAGELNEALAAGRKALELAPDEWVAAYNLGMIEDRLNLSTDALAHLDRALELGVPDARHRLLIHLYRVRAAVNLGDEPTIVFAVEALKAERRALNEWHKLLAAEQAETLRQVLGPDVDAAGKIIDGEMSAAELVRTTA